MVLLLILFLAVKQHIAYFKAHAPAATEQAVAGPDLVTDGSDGGVVGDKADETGPDSPEDVAESSQLAATPPENTEPTAALEAIEPADQGPDDAQPSAGQETSDVSTGDRVTPTYRVGTGGTSAALQSGPHNPLVAPPNIASVVYVIDRSGSMSGGRFDKVAHTLVDAIEQLAEEQEFAVILFDDQAYKLGGSVLRNATAANVSRIRSEIEQVGLGGGTDPTEAMEIAIQLQPQTIVILSDGEFLESAVDDITAVNQASPRPVQISCVGLDADIRTLRELAIRNGPGSYVQAK